MKKIKKLLSIILCFVIVGGCFVAFPVSALSYPAMGEISSSSGKAAIYSLPGTTGHETAENKNKSKWLCDLTNGTRIKALGIEKDGDGDPWYKINYGDNFSNTGYAFVNRVSLKYEFKFDEDFEKNLKNFPESYHNALRQLHTKHPNWHFVANDLDLSFKQAVEIQYGVTDVTKTRKWVEFTYRNDESRSDLWRDKRAYNSATDKWITLESRWTYASREAIEYFMDPRNSLNEDMIFAFMKQSYQEDAKMQENLRVVIKGTFLEKGYDKNGDGSADKDAYIEDIIAAAKASKVSPYVLAATIIVEQGTKGESALISGVYSGYEGYYNFFNFSAAGNNTQEIIQNGLSYAKQNGWNSRSAAIIGGAKKYADGYISVGQDTYYYKDFNVIKEYWNHQYASALYDAWTNASYLKKGCMTNADATITFSIPVYKDMPERPCIIPSAIIETDTGYYTWRLDGTTLIIGGKGDMGIESPWLDCGVEITDVIIEKGITGIADYSFSHCESLKEVIIPDSVTKIGSSFAYCSNLKNIDIPNSVTNIGDNAFYYCTGLENITIPNSVIEIGEYAFYGCWNIQTIRVPNNLKVLKPYVFSNCEGLKSIILPKNIIRIENDAFNSCTKLNDIWYEGSKNDSEKIYVGENNNKLISSIWHYNTCKEDEHVYLDVCSKICENCEWTREAADHIYDNDCDTSCNICGSTRAPSDHVYDHKYDDDCNECGAVRDVPKREWKIEVDATGVYSLKPSDNYNGSFSMDYIVVFDNNGNKVKLNSEKGGFPLVKDQTYTIEFIAAKAENVTGEIGWLNLMKSDTIFPDTSKNDWYHDSVTYAVGAGIMSGYQSGKFGTSDSIQRQDFLVMLARYEGVDLNKYNYKSKFSDVARNGYYEAAVNWGAENGIVTGYNNGKFGVGDKVTREQLVTFLYRYAKYKGINVTCTTADKNKVMNTYSDYKNVSSFAQDAIVWAVTYGVIGGKTPTTIVPQGNAQRCEVAKIMYNIYLNDIF